MRNAETILAIIRERGKIHAGRPTGTRESQEANTTGS